MKCFKDWGIVAVWVYEWNHVCLNDRTVAHWTQTENKLIFSEGEPKWKYLTPIETQILICLYYHWSKDNYIYRRRLSYYAAYLRFIKHKLF